jgi:hypothetical protein
VLLAVAGLLATPAFARAQAPTYLDYEALSRELRALADGSEAATLRSLAATAGGRDVQVLEIGAPGGAPLAERPALLVVGNLQGDHVLGSALVVEAARHLLAADDPEVRDALAERTVYLVPRLNPDAAEAMFASPRVERRTNTRPYDDDNDGRTDEDGPEDLNGDGLVTVMRVLDPSGPYMVDPDDPRLMRRADPSAGESGGWTLYPEGVDSDGDGFLNEDGPGGVDLDRNFQHAYPYWDADAGPHMVSEPESRALMDFVIAHPNIAAILTFGTSDNLVTPPDARGALASPVTLDLPAFAAASNDDVFETGVVDAPRGGGGRGFAFGFFFRSPFRGAQPGRDNDPNSGRRPVTSVDADDRPYFETVSEAYRELTGIDEVALNREAEGAFFQYGYYQFGVPSFSTPGWGLPAPDEEGSGDAGAGDAERAAERPGAGGEAVTPPGGPPQRMGARPAGPPGAGGAAGARGPQRAGGGASGGGADRKVLGALEAAGIDAFVPWSPYEHPELGSVEIGGFRPYAVLNPPAEELPALGEAHGAFVARLAGMLPRVGVAGTETEALGGGLWRVEATVANDGYFPTATAQGLTCRCVGPVTVQIQVPPGDVVTGDPKTATADRLDGSGGRETFTWVVRGRSGQQVEIRVLSDKGGRATATVTLR